MSRTPPPTKVRVAALGEMLATASGRAALADELEAVLWRDALDAHWPACRDGEAGGFLTDLDRRWRPCGEQTKSLEHVTRHTWSFARAAALYPGRGYDAAARHGFAFLTGPMWDAQHGGFFTLVDRAGKPLLDGRKHPHGFTYAIYACIHMAPLVGEAEARRWALRTFGWLEDVAWDAEHGGYRGYYRRDGTRLEPDPAARLPELDWIGTPLDLKDLNVLGDSLGAFAALAASGWDARAPGRLAWTYRLYLDRLLADSKLMSYFYRRDWKPAPDVLHAGQQFQVIPMLIAAGELLGAAAEAIAVARRMAASYDRFFASPRGGYVFARSLHLWPLRGTDLTVGERTWWVQTEACRAFLRLALEQPEDPTFRDAFARQWTFVERNLIDGRHRGFFDSAEDGAKVARWRPWGQEVRKTSIWKDASHEAHLLMDAVAWLRHGTAAADPALPAAADAG